MTSRVILSVAVDAGRDAGAGAQHDVLQDEGGGLRGAGHHGGPQDRRDPGKCRLQEAGRGRRLLTLAVWLYSPP